MKKWERKELQRMKALELRKLAIELELPAVGTRTELIERIIETGGRPLVREKTLTGKKKS